MKHDVRLRPLLPSGEPQLYARVLQDAAHDVVLRALTGTDPQAYPQIIQPPPFIEGGDPPELPGDPVVQSLRLPAPNSSNLVVSQGALTESARPPLLLKDPHGLLAANPANWPEELKQAIARCCCGDEGSSSSSDGGSVPPSTCPACSGGKGPSGLKLSVNFAGDCSGGYILGTSGATEPYCSIDLTRPYCQNVFAFSPITQIDSVIVERPCAEDTDILLYHIGSNIFRPSNPRMLSCKWRFYGTYCYSGGLGRPPVSGDFSFVADTFWEVGDFTLNGPCNSATGTITLKSIAIDLPLSINSFIYDAFSDFCLTVVESTIGVTISNGGVTLCAGSAGTTTSFSDPGGTLASLTCKPVSIDWEFYAV